jgi:Tol biopolymer transport system component
MPLPTTSFVFAKILRRGQPERWDNHLYAFDKLTGEEHLISVLDDNGMTGTWLQGLAISPDRRWIAFAADNFRLDDADRTVGIQTMGSIWLVSVDGKQFKRLTPPFALDAACFSEKRCREEFQSSLRDPTFAPDGGTIYYEHATTRPETKGDYSYNWRLAQIPTGGGTPTFLREPPGCSNPVAPSVSPSGHSLVALQDCPEGLGLYEWNLNPISLGRQLYRGRMGDVPAVWSSDGTKAFFGVVDEAATNNGATTKYGLYAWDACEEQGRIVFSAPGGAEPSSPALSPDDGTLVVEMRDYPPAASGSAFDIFALDVKSATLTKLTHDGNSTRPRW